MSLHRFSVGFPREGGELVVLDGVDIRVHAGETVALVGESGCGKTITALAMADLLPSDAVTHGSLRFQGRPISELAARDREALRGREIAFIAQEPMLALDPSFTIGSQLVEPLRRLRRLTRREARRIAVDLLSRVGIPNPEAVAKKYPHQVSGGMAQRVAIAIALTGEPRLIIADEPTTALDVTVQAEILGLLRTVQRETGAALVVVTHDWGVVADIADRAIVMYAGEVVEEASTASVFAKPEHPYTRALLNSTPRPEHVGAPLPTIAGRVPPPGSWPQGCHFQNRCAFAVDACRIQEIPLREVAESSVRCIRAGEKELSA